MKVVLGLPQKINAVAGGGVTSVTRAEAAAVRAETASVNAMAAVATVAKTTQALLYADLAHAADTIALVTNDSTSTKNGLYIKIGASGAGSWNR